MSPRGLEKPWIWKDHYNAWNSLINGPIGFRALEIVKWALKILKWALKFLKVLTFLALNMNLSTDARDMASIRSSSTGLERCPSCTINLMIRGGSVTNMRNDTWKMSEEQ